MQEPRKARRETGHIVAVSALSPDNSLTWINSVLTAAAAQVRVRNRMEPVMSGEETSGQPPQSAMIRVWSPVIRITHWTLVAGFAVAYLTEDDLLTVHSW